MRAEDSQSHTEPTGALAVRHDWSAEEVRALFDLPFSDLIYLALTVHRENLDANQVQI